MARQRRAFSPEFKLPALQDIHGYGYYPNLYQNRIPDQLDRVWVAGITYVRLPKNFVYLAVILNVYSRKAICGALSRSPERRNGRSRAFSNKFTIPSGWTQASATCRTPNANFNTNKLPQPHNLLGCRVQKVWCSPSLTFSLLSSKSYSREFSNAISTWSQMPLGGPRCCAARCADISHASPSR